MKFTCSLFVKNWVSALWIVAFFHLALPVWPDEPVLPVLTRAPVAKYIFYWGTAQCDLTEANYFKGVISATPAEFRQMLLSTPRLWNGKTLVQGFSFKFEGRRVNTTEYVSQIAWLDNNYGQNVIAGQEFNITGLQLDEQAEGTIRLTIRETGQKKENNRRGAWQSAPASFLNDRLLERVIWGREDIYDTANRDFFRANEFWRTVRELPVVEWKTYATPKPLAASIQFHNLGSTAFGLVSTLEDEPYRRMLENLENYRHLVKPGASISLILKTAEQHDEMFQRRVIIVPDNDPRLALRRNRDAHTLTFRWGAWMEKIEHLYLQHLPGFSGERIQVDEPTGRGSGLPRAEVMAMLEQRPELWVDGQRLPDFSFRISSDSSSARVGSGDKIPDFFGSEIKSGALERGMLQLDSFQVAGYDLPPITLFLNYFDLNNRLLVRNDFDALTAVQGSVRIKLYPPRFDKTVLHIEFSIPEQVRAALSIFEPEGRNIYLLEESFTAGQHTVKVPRSAFRSNGKHICFLNTPFGVTKQEFVIAGE